MNNKILLTNLIYIGAGLLRYHVSCLVKRGINPTLATGASFRFKQKASTRGTKVGYILPLNPDENYPLYSSDLQDLIVTIKFNER